ncbi:MAG TPA: TIGR04338 family metallohydrolase [Mycobacteriales bacterium]|nr:TIGR04338 family metallohydrolase [Mycobacteriales bacterium]
MPRDAQRSRVYAAEEAWALRLDAARLGARRSVVAGSALTLPAELRFGTLEDAQAYADHHTSRSPAPLPPVRLRRRKGQAMAHYEAPDAIALPVPRYGEPWALRESVLLHELTHHRVFHALGTTDHGPSYTACMLEVVAQALGEEAAFALRVEYGEHNVA